MYLYGDLPWLACMDSNFWADFTHADQPDQPNLYFWEKISKWANLAIFHLIWFIFGTEVIGKPLIRFRMFEVVATIFRPTSPTNQNRPKMKISNFCVFRPIWIKFGIWANNGPRLTWYKFEMATASFYASTHQQKPRRFRRGPLFFSDFLTSTEIAAKNLS